jgi:hypothetical protein
MDPAFYRERFKASIVTNKKLALYVKKLLEDGLPLTAFGKNSEAIIIIAEASW